MTGALQFYLRIGAALTTDWPPKLEGKWVRFIKQHERVMGRSVYSICTQRGEGFSIGRIEFRNQWNDWSVKFDADVPINMEILAETYAMLRELRSKG